MNIKQTTQNVAEDLDSCLNSLKSLLNQGLEGQWNDSISNAIKHIKLAKQSVEDVQ